MTHLSNHIFQPQWFGSITCLCIPPACVLCPHFRCPHSAQTGAALAHLTSLPQGFQGFLTTRISSAVVCAWQGPAGSLNMIPNHSGSWVLSPPWSKKTILCSLEAQLWGRASVTCPGWNLCCLVFLWELIYHWLSRWSHSKQRTQEWAGFFLI